MEHLNSVERRIVRRVVTDALAAGYSITVDDGGATTLRSSIDEAAILKALGTTGMDQLFFSRDGKGIGWVLFVYGNDLGENVISDYAANDATEAVLAEANAMSDAAATTLYADTGTYRGGVRTFRDGSSREDFGSDR